MIDGLDDILQIMMDHGKVKKGEEKTYNLVLRDDNLNGFFSSTIIRKQLKEKGFINTNGFVLYDSSYKTLLGGPPKSKKRLDTTERERHLLLAVKQNKVTYFV